MGKRHTGRKLALQILYQIECLKKEADDIVPDFLDYSDYDDDVKSWADELSRSAWANVFETDQVIQKYAIGWSLDRITLIDRNIMRLALYELAHTDTDSAIVLDEYIQLCKQFSKEDAYRFVNGILGSYIKDQCSQA